MNKYDDSLSSLFLKLLLSFKGNALENGTVSKYPTVF